MDVGAASDSRILERRAEEQYPHPIASAWMRGSPPIPLQM